MSDTSTKSAATWVNAFDLDRIYRNKWFKLYLPKSVGGLEWSLPEGIRLLYELAREDGNLAWAVNLGAGANFFYPMLGESLAQAVYGPERAVIAGNGTPGGTLQPQGEGRYLVRGRWDWCTGADWATTFTATVQCLDEQGAETGDTRAVVMDPSQVRLHRAWRAMGLRHSASYTIQTEGAHIDEAHIFELGRYEQTPPTPFYRFPFVPFARLCFAACVLGMAAHFMEEGRSFLENKAREAGHRKPAPFRQLEASERLLTDARDAFFQALDTAWALHLQGDELPEATLQMLDHHCFSATEASLENADQLFPWLGMAAVDTEHALNRIWRDLHTGAQHGMLRPPQAISLNSP